MNKILTTILNIGEEMLMSGAEVNRVEESIRRMGSAMGAVRTDVFVLTSYMVATFHSNDGSLTQTRRLYRSDTNIEKLHRLNALSRRVCAEKMPIEEIDDEYRKIKNLRTYPLWLETASYGFISAAFAIFFGGGIAESISSGVIGGILGLIVAACANLGLNKIFAKLLCSFSATLLALFCLHIGIVDTADNIIIGNIMTLIPGVGLTSALRDLFVGDSITGLLRTIEAVLFALAIAGGYFLSAFIMQDVSGGVASGNTSPIAQIITAFIGSTGFAVLYNIRGHRFALASLGGLLSCSAYLALGLILPNEILRYFIVAALISIYAEIMARPLKTPTTTFIMTGLIPLIPGSSLYYTMTGAFSGNLSGFIEKGVMTLGLAGALAAGIILVAGFAKTLRKN